MVRVGGFEPPVFAPPVRRSSQTEPHPDVGPTWGVRPGPIGFALRRYELLHLDPRAGSFELRAHLVGLGLRDVLLDDLGGRLDQLLRFLQAVAGDDLPDGLDDSALLRARMRERAGE